MLSGDTIRKRSLTRIGYILTFVLITAFDWLIDVTNLRHNAFAMSSLTRNTSDWLIKTRNSYVISGLVWQTWYQKTLTLCSLFILPGEIKIAKTLVAAYPSSVYHITGFVYDSSACNYGSCQFAVTVEFTNHVRFFINNLFYISNIL